MNLEQFPRTPEERARYWSGFAPFVYGGLTVPQDIRLAWDEPVAQGWRLGVDAAQRELPLPENETSDCLYVTGVYRTEPSPGVHGCTSLQSYAGLKRYARVWDNVSELEWGWTLHPSALQIWPEQSD